MKTHRHATSRIDQARRFAVVRLYDSSRSVSYTHLDVYKRQVIDGRRLFEKGKCE